MASVDFCESVAKWFGWNFSHPFERVNLVKPRERAFLARKYRDADVVLFSPPCQPYSIAGKQEAGDARTQVVGGGIEVILGIRPRLAVIECVANFIICRSNPVYKQVVVPKLTQAGYHIYIARCNAAQCDGVIPVQRDRVFIVATLYPREGELETHMQALAARPKTVLARLYPDLQLVCHNPCHSTAAVFDARKQPHPSMRTASLFPLNRAIYRARHGDAGPLSLAASLSLDRKLALAFMGDGFHWPAPKVVCQGPCCQRYYREYGRVTSFLGRSFGNIVIPAHALSVLKHCEVTSPKALECAEEEKRRARRGTATIAVGATFSDPHCEACPVIDRTDRGVTLSRHHMSNTTKLIRAHRRMGHASKATLKRLIKQGTLPELKGITDEEVDAMPPCDVCAQSKLTKQPHSRELRGRRRAQHINLIIHTDTMHRKVPSLRKDIYVQVFVDECTRFAWVEFFRAKTYVAFSAMLAKAEARLRAQHMLSAEYREGGMRGLGRPVLSYFSDHASEMVSAKQRERLARQFTSLIVISPSAKLSNGIAERANKSLLDLARSLLIGSELPIAFWAEAFEMATDIYNRTGHTANKGKSPYEVYYGHPPTDMGRIKVFGCKCFVHEDKDRRRNRSKLDETSRPCVYLGMSKDDNRSHRVFNPRTEKLGTSTSIVFREDVPGGGLVRRCRVVKARMKQVVWGQREPRSHDRERRATSRRRDQEEEEADTGETSDEALEESSEILEDEIALDDSGDEGEIDTWNQVYRARNDETFEQVADAFDVPLDELMAHNVGIPGSDVVTGYIHPTAKLRAGTGLWLPDGAVRSAEEDRDTPDPGAGTAPESEGPEESDTGPEGKETTAEESDAGLTNEPPQPESWRGRLRKRGRKQGSGSPPSPGEARLFKAAGVEGPPSMHMCVDMVMEGAAKVARHIQSTPDPDELRAKAAPIIREAEDRFGLAYQAVVMDLSKTMARNVPTPKSYREALSGEFASAWNAAVLKELKNLVDHDVWEWCELPKGRTHTIDATWAWKVKPTSEGFVDKVKARLCARGFREVYGLDFVETHAPVTTLTSVRACLAAAAKPPWKIHIWDVASAYLLSEIPEATPIYLRPFEGLEVPTNIPHTRPLVLKLKRCLYGLRSSGRRWNKTIDAKLKSKGFRQSNNDPCLYILERQEGIIRLNLHVDDCLATYNNEDMYHRFFEDLREEYKLSSSADSNMFLGMLIDRTADGGVQVHQRHFLDEVLAKHKCELWKPVINPCRKEIKLSKEQSPQTEEEKAEMARVPYRQIVGQLMYLANCTRLDIAYALNMCAKFCANPGKTHWNALKWILRYLVGTKDLCIRYGRKVPDMPFSPLHGNVDGSYGDCVDSRRSTTGFNFISYGGPIVWCARRQKSVALSTCESEYMAASEAAKEAVWLMRLFREDLGHDDLSVPTYGDLSEKEFEGSRPLTIFEDNEGCIALSRNPVHLKRSKHIDIRYHWMREKIQSGELKLSKIDTALNTADIFTKATSNKTFIFLRDKLMSQREIAKGKGATNKALAASLDNRIGKPGLNPPGCPKACDPGVRRASGHAQTQEAEEKATDAKAAHVAKAQHGDPAPRRGAASSGRRGAKCEQQKRRRRSS